MATRKVHWTKAEQLKIATRALEIQGVRPDLAGVALLREAMRCLEPHRRRSVRALSEAEWFESAVTGLAVANLAAEQAATVDLGDAVHDLLDRIRDNTKRAADQLTANTEEFRGINQKLESISALACIASDLLVKVVRELRALRSIALAAPVFAENPLAAMHRTCEDCGALRVVAPNEREGGEVLRRESADT